MNKLLSQLKPKELAKDLAYDIVGSLLIAIGIYNFALYANLPLAGISGICLILYKITGLPIGVGTVILNIPIALLCYKLLGHHFFFRSIKSMLISSFFIDVVAPLFPVYQGDRLLAAVCSGVISALGYAIIYLRNSSTGGSDFIIMAVKALKPHLSLGNITFAIDGTIILIGGLMFSDVDGIIYGIMMSFLMSMVIDKVMYGVDRGKVALIVTEHGEEIAFEVERVTGRGATFLKAQGSYTKLDKQVVMIACDNKEMFRVQQVAACGMSFAAADGHNAAHGTHMGRAHKHILIRHMEHITQLIQQRVMAADHHHGVPELFHGAEQTHIHFAACFITFQTLRHFHNAVCLHKGGDHTAAAAQGGCHQLIAHIAHTDTDKFLILQAADHRTGQDGFCILGPLRRRFQPMVDEPAETAAHDRAGDHMQAHGAGRTEQAERPGCFF